MVYNSLVPPRQRGCHGSLQMEEDDKGCPNDQDGCEWVSVSSGTGLPRLSWTKGR